MADLKTYEQRVWEESVHFPDSIIYNDAVPTEEATSIAASADIEIARLTADLAHADRTIRGLRGTLADVTRERDEARDTFNAALHTLNESETEDAN